MPDEPMDDEVVDEDDDHEVPADLTELHEVMEWEEAAKQQPGGVQ